VKLSASPLIYPIPIVLSGANVKGKPNFELLGDCGLMGINPSLGYIRSHREHYTNIGVLENKTFIIKHT
jgi:hypothetical protein